METIAISYALAFAAGIVSFLSPCVLPIVPSYVSFITGLTLEDLTTGDRGRVRRQTAIHATFFILGFTGVFVALGATATMAGALLQRALPLLQQIGGVVIVLFGLHMLGVLRLSALLRERRVQLAGRPAGRIGSLVAGVAFGAGWTPCIGPILGSILLYASMETTATQGMLLLTTYAVGLGIPFFVAAVGFNWFLAGSKRLRPWMGRLEKAAGALLVVLGMLLFTGQFAAMANFFAGFGQLINLEI